MIKMKTKEKIPMQRRINLLVQFRPFIKKEVDIDVENIYDPWHNCYDFVLKLKFKKIYMEIILDWSRSDFYTKEDFCELIKNRLDFYSKYGPEAIPMLKSFLTFDYDKEKQEGGK